MTKTLHSTFLAFFLFFAVTLFFINSAAGQGKIEKGSPLFSIEKLHINSLDRDYAAVKQGDTLLFVSNRGKDWGIIFSSVSEEYLSDLYYTTVSKKSKPRKFQGGFNTKYNEGPVTFNAKGDLIYFTTNSILEDRKSGSKNILRTLKIYKASKVNDKWQTPESLPFNSDVYGVGHPSLSADEMDLYFSSDMPGGFGGTDIYVSHIQEGKFSRPLNLGPKVNTSGNELFPFISSEGILYFSSDTHPGYGKLDVFSAHFVYTSWKNVENLGQPVNSSDDDFSFFLDKDNITGYLSSNRQDGTDDNIYKIEKLHAPCDSITESNYCFDFYEKGTLKDEELPLVYEWDLGDGTKKRGLEVSHCFETSGTYKIQLNILNSITSDKFFNQATFELEVKDIRQPYIESKSHSFPEIPIEFDGSRSKLGTCGITKYQWDFGDGNLYAGKKAIHSYLSTGIFQVSLTVSGQDDSTKAKCEACVYKNITISDISDHSQDSLDLISDVAKTIYNVKDDTNVIYKVQLTTSDTPISLKSKVFKNLKDVKEFRDREKYGYTVGEEDELEDTYPLYQDIKAKGFEDAHVVAFKDGKLISGDDTSKTIKSASIGGAHISGRVINRFGDPIGASIIVENLNNGKVIYQIESDSSDGTFSLKLQNGEMYGFYAYQDGYYSVSNFIDLVKEKRNLEIKKNLEMITIKEMDEENLAIRINNLFFRSNDFHLTKESYPELNRLANFIVSEKNLKVEISGHTDNIGDETANLLLSQKRADEVRNYLVSLGCKESTIISKGFGMSKPLISNSSERGRYLNRRVEFKFIKD